MRAFLISSIILILLFVSANAGTRSVSGQTTGLYHNAVMESWSTEPIAIYVDHAGNTYIQGGESIIFARGFLYPNERIKVIELLEKALQWAKTARKEQVEVSKPLGSFMKGKSYGEHGVKLTFFSSNKGRQTDVILHMVDFDNMFNQITLYLNTMAVLELLDLLKKVPATLEELKVNEAKAELFK